MNICCHMKVLLTRVTQRGGKCWQQLHQQRWVSSIERQEDEQSVNTNKVLHVPVMAQEVVDILNPKEGQIFVDMTFGGGGHTCHLLKTALGIRLFALDRDPSAYEHAQQLSNTNPQVQPLLGKFSEIHRLLAPHGVKENCVDGILFDVGASSLQYDTPVRGFSIAHEGPLDMRMDGERNPEHPSAADIVNYMEEEGLYKLIKRYGEEKNAKLIARAIVDSRYTFGKIKTTKHLADVVASVFQINYRHDKLNRRSHVATKTFQALRTFVNNELNELNNGLEIAHRLLKPHGICVAIAFHSLEDRIIKRHFHGIDMDEEFCRSLGDQVRKQAKNYQKDELQKMLSRKWHPLKKSVILPKDEEVEINPRARSAKLRAAYKMSDGHET